MLRTELTILKQVDPVGLKRYLFAKLTCAQIEKGINIRLAKNKLAYMQARFPDAKK